MFLSFEKTEITPFYLRRVADREEKVGDRQTDKGRERERERERDRERER